MSTAASGSASAITESTNYDALGRVCQNQEQVGSSGPYSFGYVYNLAGGLTSEIYPSGRTVNTTYDPQNRPSTLSAGSTTYAGSVGYASNDAVSRIAFGAAAAPWGTETASFDAFRQQPTGIVATMGATTQLTLNYWYCAGQATSCANNNGNVRFAGIVTPSLNLTQTFGYDTLNRIGRAAETGGSVEWSQTFAYDRWGNRSVSGYIPNPYATPTALTQYQNNQWAGTGATYDTAGNQLSLPSRSFGYDAENRLISTAQPSMPAISYAYDGAGRRVLKTVGSTSTVYVYDAAGQLAAEYSSAAATASGTQYVIADALGSTRMLLTSAGTPTEMLDYLPFGEEISSGVGSRNALYPSGGYPSVPDEQPLKFTSKERDPKASGVWVMDATPVRGNSPGYPSGYVTYENTSCQGVNPQAGRTAPNSDPARGIPLSPPKGHGGGGTLCP